MASHYYTWQGRYVHYVKRGLGDPIVLVHNLYPGASHEEFVHNIDELARHYTVYAPDLPGFGDSDAPRMKYTAERYVEALDDFLRDEVGAPAHVLGVGLPCAYVSEIAARRPEAFGRIVFVCPRSEPTGLDIPRWAAPIRHFMLTAPGMGSGTYEALAGPFGVRQYLQGCFFNQRLVTDELVERIHNNAMRPGSVHAYASLVTGYADHSLLASLPRVGNEILLIWGRQARPTPVEHSVRLLAMAPKARLQVIERAGSWVHDEQSAQVNRLVLQFLAGELAKPTRAVTA